MWCRLFHSLFWDVTQCSLGGDHCMTSQKWLQMRLDTLRYCREWMLTTTSNFTWQCSAFTKSFLYTFSCSHNFYHPNNDPHTWWLKNALAGISIVYQLSTFCFKNCCRILIIIAIPKSSSYSIFLKALGRCQFVEKYALRIIFTSMLYKNGDGTN